MSINWVTLNVVCFVHMPRAGASEFVAFPFFFYSIRKDNKDAITT